MPSQLHVMQRTPPGKYEGVVVPVELLAGGEAQGLVRQARLLMVLLLLVEQALGQLQVVLQAVLPGLRCLPARAAGRMKLLLPLGCCCFCRCC